MANYNDLIKKTPLVLVDFTAGWCGPCQTLAPVLQEVKAHFAENLSILKIDVDKNPALARGFAVQGVPTLILYHLGQQVWRQSGLLTQRDLIAIIEKYIS